MSSKQITLTQLVSNNKKQRTDDDTPKGIAGSAITYEKTTESNASDPIIIKDDFPESTQQKPPALITSVLDYPSAGSELSPTKQQKQDITIIPPKSNFINVSYTEIYNGAPPDPSTEPSRQLCLRSTETTKRCLNVGGMFSGMHCIPLVFIRKGIGGLERAFLLEGHSVASICEINMDSRRVLDSCFDMSTLSKGFFPDVKNFHFSRTVDIAVLGFPCKVLQLVFHYLTKCRTLAQREKVSQNMVLNL